MACWPCCKARGLARERSFLGSIVSKKESEVNILACRQAGSTASGAIQFSALLSNRMQASIGNKSCLAIEETGQCRRERMSGQ